MHAMQVQSVWNYHMWGSCRSALVASRDKHGIIFSSVTVFSVVSHPPSPGGNVARGDAVVVLVTLPNP